MSISPSKVKRVASNTILLYFRMLFVMGVSLFTSRINIKALGLEDYGLFNVVAGIIGLVAFLNSALGTSSSRYITVSLSDNDLQERRLLFCTIFKVHVLFGIVVTIIAELVGVYMINNILSIPSNRLLACNIIFQCSIVIMFANLLNIPMTASIIAHEKFKAFAYIGIYEVIAKLISSYLLFVGFTDRLILWGILNLLISISLWGYYIIYSKRHFDEFHISGGFDKSKARQISTFSFWNILGSLAIALKNAGVNMVLNIFFGPLVNAANAIAYQVNNAITNFSANFTTALNPQIYKSYAHKRYNETETLVHWGGKLSFYLVAVLGLPLLVEMDYVLKVWLDSYPAFAPVFCKLIIVLSWIECFNYSIGTAVQANGNIKYYQLFVSGLSLLNLPLTYIALHYGASPDIALEISIIIAITTLILRIFFLKKLVGFSQRVYYKKVLLPSAVMILFSLSGCFMIHSYLDTSIFRLIIIACTSTLLNSLLFYSFLNREYRKKISNRILKKIHIQRHETIY